MLTILCLMSVFLGRISAVTLFCPTGKTYSVYDPSSALAGFEQECQCQDGSQCLYDTNAPELGCSSMMGPYVEWRYNVKPACILHDICYELGRSQDECDLEFFHNFLELCRPDYNGLDMGCQETAEIALKLVQDYGKFFYDPVLQCERTYTTHCQAHRDYGYWSSGQDYSNGQDNSHGKDYQEYYGW